MTHFITIVLTRTGTENEANKLLLQYSECAENPAEIKMEYARIGGRWNGAIVTEDEFNPGAPWIENNSCPAERLIAWNFETFAIITPDGEWYDGEEPTRETWQDEATALYEKYRECVAVLADCKI